MRDARDPLDTADPPAPLLPGAKPWPIGVFARITGLTVGTLRHYDEIGLLHPAIVDPQTGYRSYLSPQTWHAERIRVLRALEVPLDEIREFLREPDPDVRRATLARHRRRVEERLARDARNLEALRALESGDPDPIRVDEKAVPARFVAFVRYVTAISTVERDREEAIERVRAFALAAGATPGPGYSRSLEPLSGSATDGYRFQCGEDEFVVETGVFLDRPVDRPAPPGGLVETAELPPQRVAFAVHDGPYGPLHLLHSALLAWAARQGREARELGREVYLVGPRDGAPADRFRTEVQLTLA